MAKKGEDKQEAQAGEAPKKKGKGLVVKLLLILIILGVLGGGGFFAYTKFLSPPPAEEGAAESKPAEDKPAEDKGHGKDEKGEAHAGPAVVALNPFIVNLADPQGKRYLKLSMEVEARTPEIAQELTASQAKARDAVILLLSSKTYGDLSSLENKILLKEEIVERLNQVLGAAKVSRVYFTELVIQ